MTFEDGYATAEKSIFGAETPANFFMLLADIEQIGHMSGGRLDVLGVGSCNLDPVFILDGPIAKRFLMSGVKPGDKVHFTGKIYNSVDGYGFYVTRFIRVKGLRRRKFSLPIERHREIIKEKMR